MTQVTADVELIGDEELERKLHEAEASVDGEQKKNTKKAAVIVREEASERAPVGVTGELHENIIDEKLEEKGDTIAYGVGPDQLHFYGMFPELGLGQPAQPFLRPAFDNNTDKILQVIGNETIEGVFDLTDLPGGVSLSSF